MTSRQADRAILSWLLDLILLGMSLIVASWLRDRLPLGPNFAPAAHLPIFVFVLVGLIWSVLFVTMGIYRPMRLGQLLQAWRLALLHLAAALLLAGLVYLIWREFSRYLFIYFVLLSLALLVTWRWLAWIVYTRGRIHEPVRIAIVGTGPEALDIYTRITSSYDLKPELIGFISEENALGPPHLPVDRQWLGDLSALPQLASTYRINEVVIALPSITTQELSQIAAALRKSEVRLYLYLDFSSIILAYPQFQEGPLRLVDLRASCIEAHEWLLKRLMDLFLASLFLILFLPLMVLIGVAIRLDSPGPIILKQWRVGENGKRFPMLKFRSMVGGAETQQGFVNEWLPNGDFIHKQPHDPRVTRVGRFLRRWSLDELPQLTNVLAGDMSLVGPRPELPWIVEKYKPGDYRRLVVPPGVTGWWQINGRSDRPMHLCVSDDLYYIENYSLWLDLMILLRTPLAVLRGQGAY